LLRHVRRLGQRVQFCGVCAGPREPLRGVWTVTVGGLDVVAVTAQPLSFMPILGRPGIGASQERSPWMRRTRGPSFSNLAGYLLARACIWLGSTAERSRFS